MSEIIPNVVISMPSQLFTMARSFKACSNGRVYIGKIDTDPTIPENQIQVYLEREDGVHIPVSQPIIINAAGYPVYAGQIAKFVTVEGHSMAVYDSYGAQQFYFPNILKYDPDRLEQRLSQPDGSKFIGRCRDIEHLRTIEPTESGQFIPVESVTTKLLGQGGALWYYDQSDITTPDNGIWCVVTLNGHRWKIANFDKITSQMAGMEQGAGKDSHSQSAKLQNALDCARVYTDSDWEGHAHYPVVLGGGTFRIDETVYPRRVPLIGSGQGATTLYALNNKNEYCLWFEHDKEYQGMGPELRDLAIYGHTGKGVFFNTAGVNMSKVSLSNMGAGLVMNNSSDIVMDAVVYDQVQIGMRIGYCKNAVISNQCFFWGNYGIYVEDNNTQISLNNISVQYFNSGVIFAGIGSDISIGDSSFLLNGPQVNGYQFGGFISMSNSNNSLRLSDIQMRNPFGYAMQMVGAISNITLGTNLFISGKPNVPDHGLNNNAAGILANGGTINITNLTLDFLRGYGIESTGDSDVVLNVDGISTTIDKFSLDQNVYFNFTNTGVNSKIKIYNINFPIEKDIFDAANNQQCVAEIIYNSNMLSFFKSGSNDTMYTRFPAKANTAYIVKIDNAFNGTYIVSLDQNTGNTKLNIIELKSDPSISFYIGDHIGTKTEIPGAIKTHFISVGWKSSGGSSAKVTVTSL
ncbi:phage head-binding domain-containing protein [Xenorhabdus bovienii]|uniref:phage head-binding domain-containing protein n=1 Tax=Xenorhabdus bovienii TaxID=40576 RepID=UPI0023B33812|nr:phage tailspike protein [Xenorhabdus bovienii]